MYHIYPNAANHLSSSPQRNYWFFFVVVAVVFFGGGLFLVIALFIGQIKLPVKTKNKRKTKTIVPLRTTRVMVESA